MAAGLSAILNAVRPRDRSDQLAVLAALFDLGAYQVPATVKDIRERLSLHLGNKTPRNISACLRKYKACVEPADKGPPLKWRLTDVGIAKLRTLTDLPLTTAAAANAFGCDIAIVCALEQPEFEAVRDALGGNGAWKVVGNPAYAHVYRETTLLADSGKSLRVIATVSTSMGLTAAAIATTQLILQFRPRLVAMIGIAAGTRSGNKKFGDVLVADPSIDYNSGKVVSDRGIREFQPDPYPIGLNVRLRTVLQRYASNGEVFKRIQAQWRGARPDGTNRIHIGPLGAADQVIDDASRILEIQKNWRKLVGVEMETYAVYRACHESPEPKPRMVSFKAVCDFAAEKTDSWQAYAAFSAAEFAVQFLKSEWEALWPD